MQNTQQQQEMHRREHLDWLSSMEADLQSHRRSSGCYSAADSSPELDFAVGSAREEDEIPSEALYRSLNLADDPEGASFAADEIIDDPPVYRSLSSSITSNMGSATDDDDAMATWLAQPRPPLLRRQNAFANVYSQQAADSWGGRRP